MSRLGQVATDLRKAFDEGGVGFLHRAHLAARRRNITYRLLSSIGSCFLPINPLFEIVKDLDRLVGELGVHEGSRVVLARGQVPWRLVLPESGESKIRAAPAIFYGTHGSIITPLLLAAALERPDLKMIAATYIAKLGPNIGQCSYGVCATKPLRLRMAGRQGLTPRLMGWLTDKLEHPIEQEIGKERNSVSLGRAAEHVRRGGGLLIAPESRTPGEAWRPGLGRLVADLARDPGPQQSFLIAWRIWNCSISGILHLLCRNPLLKMVGRMRFRQPVRVQFAEPITLQSVVDKTGLDRVKITNYLAAHYRELGF